MTEREFATDVVARLQAAGFEALFAGGCVRDELLGIEPADYDIATSATPDQVKQHFRKCHSFGASFGVVEVLGPRDSHSEWLKVQVATFRSDGTYTDGRRPDSVVFSSPAEDAARRDFTINGLFRDPMTGKVFDYVGGERDLRNKVLRAIGDPVKRFEEDKLRILRAVRMAARFELEIDVNTFNAAAQMADQLRIVSAERIAEEFRKILSNSHRGRGVRLLYDIGIAKIIFPEIGSNSRTWYDLESVVRALPEAAAFPLAFAAVIHKLPATKAEGICRQLRLSNLETEAVTWLVARSDALRDAPAMRPSRLYPILAHPGVHDLLALHNSLAVPFGLPTDHVAFCEQLLRKVPPETFDPPPILTGDDLVGMGMKPGKEFKRILETIRHLQLDGELANKDSTVRWVQEFLATSED